MYIGWPGLWLISPLCTYIFESIFLLAIIIIWCLWTLLWVASLEFFSVHPVLLRMSNQFIYTLFPLSYGIGHIVCSISKDALRRSMIDLINHLVTLQVYKVESNRILLLTPHCLQATTCVHKVTHDVHNCRRCGKCAIGDLLNLSIAYGCEFMVVTGGTLARMKVKELKPQAIIAIACERDLASGMVDVFPIPVLGILNTRPYGPCCNTDVNTELVRQAIESLIDKETYEANFPK